MANRSLTQGGQLELFDRPAISLGELFEAYADCRRNKRGTTNAVAFEVDYEANLIALWQQINSGRYRPGRSLAFIVDKPVKREIFAARFRDRVVHHLIINKLNPLFEREFIYDSYACRVGKGTHFGIARLQRFMRKCSLGGTRDAYVLRLDIRGFFMSIDRALLWRRLRQFIVEKYTANDRALLLDLCRTIVRHDPARRCIIRGRPSDWDGLPTDKSLFHSRPGCGLPIGNLTSQVFANFYLNLFDHAVKHELGIRYYGRYVDDIVIVHQDRRELAALVPTMAALLKERLGLRLHPRKVYLQHVTKGAPFLGVYVSPERILAGRRTKGNFYQTIRRHNLVAQDHRPCRDERFAFRSSINSYLGILSHYSTFRLRKRMLGRVSFWWWRVFHSDMRLIKAVLG